MPCNWSVPVQSFLSLGERSPLAGPDDLARDQQHEGAIVYLGVIAQYLPQTDPKVISPGTLFNP